MSSRTPLESAFPFIQSDPRSCGPGAEVGTPGPSSLFESMHESGVLSVFQTSPGIHQLDEHSGLVACDAAEFVLQLHVEVDSILRNVDLPVHRVRITFLFGHTKIFTASTDRLLVLRASQLSGTRRMNGAPQHRVGGA